MLLKQETLKGIRRGSISLAFRRWRRPTVKAGGTMLTPIGQLAIESVEVVEPDEITEREAAAAGFPNLASLRAELQKRTGGHVYRVRFSLSGPDPRIALRKEIPQKRELQSLLERLDRLDARSSLSAWTQPIMAVIRDRPNVRAADLATDLGMDRDKFKANVRKLKGLGLTESLEVGYRLSPRGEAVLQSLGERRGGSGVSRS